MPLQYMTIKPPLGGVVESTGLEDQPVGTCADALNCWPRDEEHRARLAARPGITSYATGGTTSPGTQPVRMLSEVNYATAKETTRYLVASSGGTVYTLSTAGGGWTEIAEPDVKLSSLNPIQAAPFGNKLFIADWEEVSSTNSGDSGVIGNLRSTKTGGATSPMVWTFDASGDGWTEANGSNYEYTYDLTTHGAITIPSETRGARFDGYGSLNRSGIALPADGEKAVWSAKLGPWDGDAFLIGGIGDGSAGIPTEYALGYDADGTESNPSGEVYAYVGGTLVETEAVSGKTYCLFKIELSNSGGTIAYKLTVTDLSDDSVKLTKTGDRAYTGATLSSEIISDRPPKKIFVDEVRYNAGETVADGTDDEESQATVQLTDPSVTDWTAEDDAKVDDLVVFTGSVKGVYKVVGFSDDKRAAYLKWTSTVAESGSVSVASGLRYHIISESGTRNTFVVPDNKGWTSALAHSNILRISSHEDEKAISSPSPEVTVTQGGEGGGFQVIRFSNTTEGTFKLQVGYTLDSEGAEHFTALTGEIVYTSAASNMASRIEVAINELSGVTVTAEEVAGAGGTKITFTDPASETLEGGAVDDLVVIGQDLINSESRNLTGFWEVTASESDILTITPAKDQALVPNSSGYWRYGASWSTPRTAKVVDLEERTLKRWEATPEKGNVPHGSKMIAAWQDRMVMGNDQVAPHVWHMSRNGSPYDWLYGAEDLGSPVAGTTFQGGLSGEPLTALVSHNKSCLLLGCKDSLWVLRGDPMQGGYIERLTDDIGILGPWSHTKTDKDATYFLSHLGLYAMPSGCGDVPTPVGETHMPHRGPKFWRDTDQLGFDGVYNGLILSTVAAATATRTNYWYDLGSGGWWPFSLDAGTGKLKEVTSLLSWQPAAGRDPTFELSHLGSLMIGCDNGKVCRLDGASGTDEGGSAVAAHAQIGPMNFTPSSAVSGMIQEVRGLVNHSAGGTSTQTLYVGVTASDALAQAVASSGGFAMTWDSDYAATIENPRMSGHSLVLVVSGSGRSWAFEEASLSILPLGKAR